MLAKDELISGQTVLDKNLCPGFNLLYLKK